MKIPQDIVNTSPKNKGTHKGYFWFNCLVVPVSAMDYRDGVLEQEEELIRESHIGELKKLINILSKKSKEAFIQTKRERFERKYEELYNKLNNKIQKNKREKKALKREHKELSRDFKGDIEVIENRLKSMYSEL